jgi:hypothetical protein
MSVLLQQTAVTELWSLSVDSKVQVPSARL